MQSAQTLQLSVFGNVHGVYKPGNVKLTPTILRDSQKYVAEKFGTREENHFSSFFMVDLVHLQSK